MKINKSLTKMVKKEEKREIAQQNSKISEQ